MSTASRKMVLTTLLSCSPYSWVHDGIMGMGDMDFDVYAHMVATAERGRLHAAFLADSFGIKEGPGGLSALKGSSAVVAYEPMTLLSALAMTSKHIGLAATVSTTFTEPYNVARQFASLDHLSHGRAAWNIITSIYESEALNYNFDKQPSSEARYERAREFVEIVADLWDSWEDDAFLRDRSSGQYFDPAKVHRLNFQGKHFSVRGPLNLPRSPQGRPVIFQAGTSDEGYELAARWADCMYVKTPTLDIAQEFYQRAKGKLAKYNRSPEEMAILPGVCVVVGETEKAAYEKLERIMSTMKPEDGIPRLAQVMGGLDFSPYPLDEPVPNLPHINAAAAKYRIFIDRDGGRLTVRQLMHYVGAAVGHLFLIGTGRQIAETMAKWMREKGADGFNLMPLALPSSLEDFVDHVVPELQKLGIFRTEYEGATLRENLGLAKPASRFTAVLQSKAS